MGHLNYSRVGRRCPGMRGFRLYPRRFSVQRLRLKFLYLYRLLSHWKSCHGKAFHFLKRKVSRASCRRKVDCAAVASSRRNLAVKKDSPNTTSYSECKLRSFARSNSFYSEAIADCLEFIKRSSISVDDDDDDDEKEKSNVISPR